MELTTTGGKTENIIEWDEQNRFQQTTTERNIKIKHN